MTAPRPGEVARSYRHDCSSMKKILVISASFPLPEKNGSRQRTMHFVRYFKRFAEVDLLYAQSNEPVTADSSLFRKVIHIPPGPGMDEFRRNAYFFLMRLPWCILAHYSADFKKRLLALLAEENYDLIFVRYSVYAQYLLFLPPAMRSRICLDFDDVLSGSMYEKNHAVSTRYAFKRRLDYRNLRAYEANCCDRLGSVLFCSDGDLNLVDGQRKTNRFVVPNVVIDPFSDAMPEAKGPASPHSLLFVGTLNYQPNSEGVAWFIREIFPALRAQFSEACLTIVGRKPGQLVEEIARHADIVLQADVPDVVPYYQQSSIVIVPLLQGSGTRIKILEAALLNRPVIATAKGAEGLDFADGKEILLFHDAPGFIDQYRKLQDRDFYLQLVRRARTKVAQRYSVDNFNATMDDILFRDVH